MIRSFGRFHFCALIFLFSFTFSNNVIMAYYDEDFDNIRSGYRVFHYAKLSWAPLSGYDLTEAYFLHTYFCGAHLQKTICKNATFKYCDFYGANFNGADLTNTSFLGSILLYVNFENTIAIGLDLKGTVGFTN